MLESLPEAMQERVVERLREYIQQLRTLPERRKLPPGTRGPELLHFAGSMPAEGVEQIRQAIEEDCERIDVDGW
jgi:hypothetical protein